MRYQYHSHSEFKIQHCNSYREEINSETSTAENEDTAGPGQHVLPGVAGGLGQLQPVSEGQS